MPKSSRKDPPKVPSAQGPTPGRAKPGRAVTWLDAPQEHDYPAAAAYLSLILTPRVIDAVIAALRDAPGAENAAKDILRASRLPLLDIANPHVAADLVKVRARQSLSPVLLIRGDAASDRPTIIADGYHRVCASYHANENTPIRVRIVDLPTIGRSR